MGTHSVKSQVQRVPNMSGEFPTIKSVNSLVAKHVTKERWDKYKDIKTKTCDLPLLRLVPVLLSLITSTVVSMLGIGIHTRTLLKFLMPLFKSTMELVQLPSIPLTWM